MLAVSYFSLASRLRDWRGLDGLPGRRCRRRRGARLARRIVEVPEEVGVGLEHKPRVVALQRRFVGLHRPVEGEEIRILVEGVGEDLVSGRVAFAADLF